MKKMLLILSLVVVIGAVGVVVAYACCGDTPPPPDITSITADPGELWPPNHKMVEVTVTVVAREMTSWSITGADSDEADDAKGGGDGKTTGDVGEISEDGHSISLRAERAGKGDGRTYTIYVTASGPGGTITTTVEVTVPHDMD